MDNFQEQQQTSFSPSGMTLSESAEHESIGVPWRILVMSVFLFALSFFIYFGLRLGYRSFLEARAKTLDTRIESLASEVSEEDQTRLVNFYSQLVNLSKVLDRHVFPANIFSFLERNTLGTVYFLQADYDAADSALSLQGYASTPETLTNQMAAFEKLTNVKRVILNELSNSKLGAKFSLTIAIDPVYFAEPR